jgi:probable rRNA maturation factor
MSPAGSEILIANRQRARRLNTAKLRELARWITAGLDQVELGFHFVGPKEMARVHEEFMDVPGSTDVITFDHGSEPPGRIHGEIFICVEDAIAQAKEFGTTWHSEVARYMIHGVLHLLGFDDIDPADRKEMKRRENAELKRAAKAFDFRALEKR